MPNDNRLMQRFSIAIAAHVEPNNGSSPDACVELLSRDVCSGGAFFLTAHPLEIGTKVLVRMVLTPRHISGSNGKKAQVTISGEILRIDKEGMAVRFGRSYKISAVRG